MTIKDFWTFLSMVQFLLCTSVVTQVNENLQENIALNKYVTQSGNLAYPNPGDVWLASNAVDGNKDCTVADKDHYSGTAYEKVPWWQVDLGNIYSLSTIVVYGQPNETPVQLKGFQVYLMTSENSKDKQHIYNNTNYGNGILRIPVQQNVFGRYVRIEMPGNYRQPSGRDGPLVLCEVEVYSTCHCDHCILRFFSKCTPPTKCEVSRCKACDDGKYGQNCSETCSEHCKHGNQQCNKTNGYCMQGCADGYVGKRCENACDDGKYGQNCSETCSEHCQHGNQQCNETNGYCMQGCADGYVGKRCENACDDGKYGQNCTETCSEHCQHGNQQCNETNGYCMQGCADGYVGKRCENACDDGKYGQNCTETCSEHCQHGNQQCNETNGYCMQGCADGYVGKRCENACDDGKYGQNCSETCSEHCQHGNQQCNETNGYCMQGCADGYVGKRCENACPPSKYGQNCSKICNNCTQMECSNTDGLCSIGCVPGYKPTDPYCNEACFPSTYGQNCTKTCNTCTQMECKNTDGLCSIGCVPGYKPTNRYCNEVCDDGQYGQNCSKSCSGHCKNGNNQCIKANGNCMQGCADGYIGDKCENKCPPSQYGENCSQICSNCDGVSCNNTDGICLNGCVPGYTFDDPFCNTTCPASTYGINCNRTCSTCADMTCNNTDGSCFTGCIPGYTFEDSYCNTTCPASTYGINCSRTCSTCADMSCNNTDGSCLSGCVPGYTFTDSSCNTNCPPSKYGENCTQICSYCEGLSCNNTDGLCLKGCVPGYTFEDPYCNTTCPASTYGINCSQTCSTCADMSCNNTDGSCFKRCVPGYIFDDRYCNTSCPASTYGINCSRTCSTCADMSCNNTDGSCFTGCVAGYTFEDSYCNTTCTVGSYGRNCSFTCSGNCLGGNEKCDTVNGTCMQECNSGFSGDRCELEHRMSSQSHSVAIGAGVGTTVALMIIGVVIGFIVYRRRNVKESSYKGNQFSNLDKALDSRKQRLSDRQGSSMLGRENSSFEGEEETAMTQSGSGDYYSFGGNFGGIKIYELWDCIKEKMENECDKFYSEFKKLPSGLVYPCTAADNLINKGKNRYKEMYAYDHTRVVLLDVEEGKNTDYINACYIDGYDKTQKFVASQGPTKQMMNDFWRMVWQLKSDKIVMLTNLIEMGTVKCLQYWPLEDEEDEHCFGNVIVRVLKTETFLDYTMRLFEVRKNGESARKIRQYHFKSWPDKDVPDSTWCLVNFWRAVNTDEPSTAGPIVVHCSAGVGRTGTFIALDNLVAQAKAEGCVRPLQIVETLRRQRVNMVQTREQYVYLHEAVADALLFGTHFVFTKQFGEMFSFMLQKGKGETKCNLEKQFELIEKSARDMTSAGAAENVEYTNVETIQSESAAYRPKLKNRGSKFVQELGAMYIPNYKGKNTFLISMSPDKNTMEEFWSLVDDSHIKTIIMLTETSAACYQASCQLGANPKNGSKFSVNKIEEKIRKGFTERSFTFKESDREEEEYLTTVKQFEFTNWKDGSNVPGETRHMLEMINSVQKWQSHLSESQPILIHCSDGCKRSGIVCVLLNELQRILYEGGHINILESVKMMKKRQKYLIPTYEQYRFCFDLILAHSKTTEVYENL